MSFDEEAKKLSKASALKGRGAASNTPIRFESTHRGERYDPDEPEPLPRTKFYSDASRSILARNESPDVPFELSINPYRGCEHGCIYCYARPTHEYLGYSAGIDFETRIFVKEKAPQLLREALLKKSYRPQTINISGVTDCYQPIERKLQITRACLEVLAEFKNPVTLITKNFLVTRDQDLLSRLAEKNLAAVFISVTTLDDELCASLEPRTSRPRKRLEAIQMLSDLKIPVGVMVAPVIPGLTDSEMPQILKEAHRAGARFAGYVPLRLPFSVAPLFTEWVELHCPLRKDKILNRIKSIRSGKMNDSQFGSRMQGEGIFADQMHLIFDLWTRKLGLNQHQLELSTAHFTRPTDQMTLL